MLALVLLAPALSAGCDDDEPAWVSPIAFDTAAAWVVGAADSVRLTVELAETDEQRSFGLMRRPALDSMSGMLFVYPSEQDERSGFWMWRTLVPLDIAFLNEDGRILRILQMVPCENPYPEYCPSYAPGVPYHAALEVNRGWFERYGFGVGDRVHVEQHGQDG